MNPEIFSHMHRKAVLLALCFIVQVTRGTLMAKDASSDDSSHAFTEFYSPESCWRTVSNAASIMVCMLEPGQKSNQEAWSETTAYKAGPCQRLTNADMLKVVSALSDPHNYRWSINRSCIMRYDCRLVFNRGSHIVVMDICFRCKGFRMTFDGLPYKGVASSPVADAVFEIAAGNFPNDAALAKIKKDRQDAEAFKEKILHENSAR